MTITASRRGLLNFGVGTAVTLGVSTLVDELVPLRAHAQAGPASNVSKEELFYREDWFGEPWRKPEVAVLIHGNDESSVVWYGWVPRMGAGVSAASTGFAGIWTLRDSSGVRMVAAESCCVRSTRARQGRRRGGAHHWCQNWRRDCDAVCGGLSYSHPHARSRQWSRFRDRRFQSLQHSPTRPTGFGCFERDGRILEPHVCNSARGRGKRTPHGALEIRSGTGRCFAADQSANSGDHLRPKRPAISGEGSAVSADDS